LDFEGFYSPLVIRRYAEYMHKHRLQADGEMRDSDNWQHGIPRDAYIKSAWRHFMDWWMEHRGLPSREGLEEALCALIFNAMGYLYEVLTAPPIPLAKDRVCFSCKHETLLWNEIPCSECLNVSLDGPEKWEPK